jgi:hypothetical protein
MSTTLSSVGGPPRRPIELTPFFAAFGLVVALAVGMAFGVPTPEYRILSALAIGAVAMVVATAWPLSGLSAMIFTAFLLIVWMVPSGSSLNLIDVFMGPVLVAALFGGARDRARHEDLALPGEEHARIRGATQQFRRSVAWFYACAIASLVYLALRGHPDWAFASSLLLFRGFQGLLFFALCIWWLRSEANVRNAIRAVQAAGWGMLLLNAFFFVVSDIKRAGMTWVINMPEWPMSSPNEAAVSLLVIWAMLSAVPDRARRIWYTPLKIGLLVLLVLTQSRSGLLAWALYFLFSVNWARWRSFVAIPITVGIAAMLAPDAYRDRLIRTFSLRGGSFEAYSSLMRFFSWQAAMRSIAVHPIFGVGYLGFRFISADYNDLHAYVGTESYFFEVAVGMGIIGIVLLARVLASLFRLGAAVRDSTPPGSFGNELARRHTPLMIGLLAANLTGDNFVGMAGLGQVAIWCAILVRSGHLSVSTPRS